MSEAFLWNHKRLSLSLSLSLSQLLLPLFCPLIGLSLSKNHALNIVSHSHSLIEVMLASSQSYSSGDFALWPILSAPASVTTLW